MTKNSELGNHVNRADYIGRVNELYRKVEEARSAWYAAHNMPEKQREAAELWRTAEIAYQQAWNEAVGAGYIPIATGTGEGFR